MKDRALFMKYFLFPSSSNEIIEVEEISNSYDYIDALKLGITDELHRGLDYLLFDTHANY